MSLLYKTTPKNKSPQNLLFHQVLTCVLQDKCKFGTFRGAMFTFQQPPRPRPQAVVVPHHSHTPKSTSKHSTLLFGEPPTKPNQNPNPKIPKKQTHKPTPYQPSPRKPQIISRNSPNLTNQTRLFLFLLLVNNIIKARNTSHIQAKYHIQANKTNSIKIFATPP